MEYNSAEHRQQIKELAQKHRVLSSDPDEGTLECAHCGTVEWRVAHRGVSRMNSYTRSRNACPNELAERIELDNEKIRRQALAPALSLHWNQSMRELYRDSAG